MWVVEWCTAAAARGMAGWRHCSALQPWQGGSNARAIGVVLRSAGAKRRPTSSVRRCRLLRAAGLSYTRNSDLVTTVRMCCSFAM